MSHLLCLHSFAVDRFVNVFGGGRKANIDALLGILARNVQAKTTPAKAKAIVTNAVMKGLSDKPLPKADQAILDLVVYEALSSEAFAIGAKPISPMGLGGRFFDDFEQRFKDAKATKLFEVLQRGRNYENAFVLLSSSDVVLAAKQLKRIAEADEDDVDEGFVEELVEPFATSAKKGHAIYGRWG